MAEILHLGQVRRQKKKAAARAEKDAQAAENRAKHGRTKSQMARDRAAKSDRDATAERLDAHRRTPSIKAEDDSGEA